MRQQFALRLEWNEVRYLYYIFWLSMHMNVAHAFPNNYTLTYFLVPHHVAECSRMKAAWCNRWLSIRRYACRMKNIWETGGRGKLSRWNHLLDLGLPSCICLKLYLQVCFLVVCGVVWWGGEVQRCTVCHGKLGGRFLDESQLRRSGSTQSDESPTFVKGDIKQKTLMGPADGMGMELKSVNTQQYFTRFMALKKK